MTIATPGPTDVDRSPRAAPATTDDRREPRTVTGRIEAGEAGELERFASDGGTVVVVATPRDEVGESLAGARFSDRLPLTEWFVTLADRPEAVRLDPEVPLTTSLVLLDPFDPDVEVAATTSVRFRHEPTVVVRRVGAGRVVTLGVDSVGSVEAHPTLSILLRRLVRGEVRTDTSELGVGVVGYGPFGGMGYLHGLAATETDGLALVAAADSSAERIDAARGDFAQLRGHDSATALAADPDVDVAIVATPPVLHAEIARELLRAGKHVVVEKPMCLATSDADELIALARDVDRTITVHQSRRWDTDWLAIRRLVDRGDLGDVFNIETFVGGFEHPCRAWHSEESISGGAVYDWGSHHVDWIVQHYGHAPSRVLCSTHARVWHDTTNVDQLSVWMQWPDGREATFRQSDVCAIRRPKFHVEGTAGTLEGRYDPIVSDRIEPGRGHRRHESHHAERPVELHLARYDGDHGLVESTVRPAPHPGWGFHRNLADHLLLDEPLAVRPEQSRDVVAVLEAAHRSGANGELVEPA
ncbi:Gfo/Idh/MocA family protein [Ilumatobacter sp.]|uniref:Gfo/Idh/MocA family protein n=1 Tax=Ilumatobacter sp. TaxID=1967498 RepID=UPI003B51625C